MDKGLFSDYDVATRWFLLSFLKEKLPQERLSTHEVPPSLGSTKFFQPTLFPIIELFPLRYCSLSSMTMGGQ